MLVSRFELPSIIATSIVKRIYLQCGVSKLYEVARPGVVFSDLSAVSFHLYSAVDRSIELLIAASKRMPSRVSNSALEALNINTN